MLKLLIEDGDGKSKLAPINPDNAEGITIGRKEGNTIRLKERNVSRNHARIFSTPEGVFIEPVAARYGLKVNSEKIEGKTKIGFGDEIRIGDYHLYLQDENNQPVAKQEEQGVYDLPIGQQPKFVVITSNFAGKELVITKSEVTIGRAPTNLLHLDHISVSGTHAKVTRNHRGEFILEDLNSSNGTVVNGNPLTGKHLLQSGDTIMLGHVGMRYCSPGELWYLHLSDDDNNRRQGMSTGMVVLIVALCMMVAVLLTVLLVYATKDKEPQTPVAQQPTSGISNEDVVMMDVKNSLLLCKQYIMNGDFEKARVECDKAESLAPNDPNVSAQLDELRKEETSNREYEHILRLLDEKACQDALTEIEMLDSRSYAGRQARMDGLEQKAIECRDKGLVKQFNEGIEREDYVEAKNALDTLMRAGTLDDSKLDRMRNELDRKMNPGRPRTGGGGSSRGSGSSGGSDSAAAAPAPAPAPAPEPGGTSFASAEDAKKAIMKCKNDKKACDAAYKQFKNDPEITCKYAIALKSMGKTCDAYKIFKKADASCPGGADFIAKHEECK